MSSFAAPAAAQQPDPAPGQEWYCTVSNHPLLRRVEAVTATTIKVRVLPAKGTKRHHAGRLLRVPWAGFKSHNRYLRG